MASSASSTALAHAASLTGHTYVRCQISPQGANDNEAVIDLFAGGGGTSEGVFEVFGFHPDLAVNHNAEALALHAANHPSTVHLQEDIRRIDVEAAIRVHLGGRRVAILWASPDCRHFSKASGDQLKDRGIRGLAWEVLRWSAGIKRATGHLPRLVALENVEEIQTWGPVHRYGEMAGRLNKKRQGETWDLFIANLKSLGFVRVEWRELVAADYGVPTTRKRLYLVAMSQEYDAEWPAATHAPRQKVKAQADLFGEPEQRLEPYRSAASIIDWSIAPETIFDRKRPLKPKTLARIGKGIRRYVIESPDPFIVPVTHSNGWNSTKSATEPLGTMTTAKGGEFAVGAPTILPVNHGGGEGRVYDPLDPMRTATGAPRGEQALASAFLKPRYGEREGQEPRALDIKGPAPATVPTGNGGDLAAVYLGRQFGSTVSGRDMAEPHPTAMTDGAGGKSQVVAASLSRMAKGSTGGEMDDPTKTGTAHAKDAVVAAHLTGVAYGDDRERAGLRAWPMQDPTRAIAASGDKAVSAVWMDQQNGDRVGRAANDAVTSLTHRSTQQHVAAAFLDKYYGSGVPAEMRDALDTVTSEDRFSQVACFMEQANTGMVGHEMRESVSTLVGAGSTQRLVAATLQRAHEEEGPRRRQVLEFLWEQFGLPTEAEIVDPLATSQGRLKFGLVVLGGFVFKIVDIGMRMLTPRELFRAQGFKDSYVLDVVFEGKPLTKTALTRAAGNSVCPGMAAAVLRAFAPPSLRERAMAA